MAQSRWLIALTFVVSSIAAPVGATTSYIYPLDSWKVSTTHGEELSDGLYHMGIDVGNELLAGAVVYAVADGIVREAQERTQFGLVVLIEHLPEGESNNVSLYGHLDPTDVRVTVGQSIKAGDIIGVLGSRTNNGGWNPHLHFGIHKQSYTGEWVYYGHVKDVATAEDWYDPVVYISEHLLTDTWAPTIQLDIADGAIVGNTADFTMTARDVGSRVKKVTYRISLDEGVSWTMVNTTIDPSGDIPVQLPLADYPDGPVLLKVTVRDYFDHTSYTIVRLLKDPHRYTSPAFIAIKTGQSDSFITQWSYGATPVVQAFFPFSERRSQNGDVALGDVVGDGTQKIIAGRGSPRYLGKVKVFSQAGGILSQFKLDQFGAMRLTTGELTGDTVAEIIIASGVRDVATVQARDYLGQVLWSVEPLGAQPGSFDVATGNLDDDVFEEVVAVTRAGLPTEAVILDQDGTELARFFPFRKSFTGGANVAVGDINGDGQNELIFGSESGRPGTVKIFDLQQQKLMPSFRPFGDEFIGAVDVAITQWDVAEDVLVEDEIIVSQASAGQAWVKAYRLSGEPEILLTKRVYEPGFDGGTRIVGY